MNKQWNKDGLTRKKLENDFRIHEPFQVLEKNLSNLLARAFSKSSSLIFLIISATLALDSHFNYKASIAVILDDKLS